MRRLVGVFALMALLAFGGVSAQTSTASPPAPISPVRQDKINQIVSNNPLATEDGKRVWGKFFKATVILAITKAGQKAGLGSEWGPQHPLWQEIEQSALATINELAASTVQQTQKQLPAALAGFTDDELDTVLRVNQSPLVRKAGEGLGQAIQLLTYAASADKNDPTVKAYLKAEEEKQQQLLKEITSDPEMARYMKSSAAQKMMGVSLQAMGEQMPQMTIRMELADADMHLRIALYQTKPAADIAPLRNAMMFAAANAGNLDELKEQLALGADAHARDTRQGKNKGTLLHYAVIQPDTGMLDFLLAHGLRDLVDTLSGSGQSPLHATAASNRLAHAARLLDAGANILLTTNGRGAAIHAAATKGHLAMTKFLVSRGGRRQCDGRNRRYSPASSRVFWRSRLSGMVDCPQSGCQCNPACVRQHTTPSSWYPPGQHKFSQAIDALAQCRRQSSAGEQIRAGRLQSGGRQKRRGRFAPAGQNPGREAQHAARTAAGNRHARHASESDRAVVQRGG